MHMIAPPSEDNVGHFFKVQKSRMMLLHVRVHIHTSMCVCVHVCNVHVHVCVFTLYACASASGCKNVLSLLMQTIHAC